MQYLSKKYFVLIHSYSKWINAYNAGDEGLMCSRKQTKEDFLLELYHQVKFHIKTWQFKKVATTEHDCLTVNTVVLPVLLKTLWKGVERKTLTSLR